jgi:molecular chaperone DnaK
MTGEDAEAIEAKTQALLQSAMKLGEAMYKASQAEGAAAPGGGGSDAGPGAGDKPDDKVVDATYEEVDDKKNDKKSGPSPSTLLTHRGACSA